ncbi:copper homeostasis protein [Anaerobacterium chartisolvens]|uniref:PF03932 family protein CutC n=1 Tax=Anaerobacterium chartisolvens TaxID=1297424 RepID=A0A369BB97_9FIRM|nr:copper homeostasis protein CutC [Anaerobacterium chartisolvens]RCX18800.1 copper homeostasis protein [Anaerobacterium chartisolvens]
MEGRVLTEICCGSLDDALIAQQAGADRIELNSCLQQGGLTPSLGTFIEAKKRLKIPVMVMVRPREAGFDYSGNEIEVMERDAGLFIEHGAEGIVFGFLNSDGTINLKNSQRMMKIIGRAEAVFHRAFDVVPDPFKALDQLIEIGVTRVLTSGQEASVYDGVPLIAELVKYAKGRIQILPGAGIKLGNVQEIIHKTGVSQIHFASIATRFDTSTAGNSKIFFGGAYYPPEDRHTIADLSTMKKIIQKTAKN